MLQRLTGCPRYTFTKESLWSLRALGMAQEFAPVRICASASMVRMATTTATTFHAMKDLWDAALGDDLAPIASLACRNVDIFDTLALVDTLQEAVDGAFLPDIHRPGWVRSCQKLVAESNPNCVQRSIARFIAPLVCNFNAFEFLSKRMARWRIMVSSDAQTWWDLCGAFAVRLYTVDLKGSPQCVIAACLKTGLNGWVSSRRLKMEQSCCVFGCGVGEDCIEHYLNCNLVAEAWSRLFRTEWGTFESRLAFGCANLHDRVRRAFFLFGLFAAYNHMRHHSAIAQTSDVVLNIIASKIIFAAGRSRPGIRKLLYQAEEAPQPRAPRVLDAVSVGDVLFDFRKRAAFGNAAKGRPAKTRHI